MLVICSKTGMTYDRKVYKEGEIVVLTGQLESDYGKLSDEKWLRKQNRTYGFVLFRRPTNDEIIAAIRDKELDPGSVAVRKHMSKQQLRIAYDYAESKEAKKLKAIQMLREGLDIEVEEAPEEKAEVVKAPEKKVEAPKEKVEPIELPEESEETIKEPAEKAPEIPEEPAEKAPEAPKEEPKATEGEEPKEPVEEPDKEASGKKDKKKNK